MLIIKNLIQSFERNLVNFPGWHTKRKIVVIESDDWGSVRMPSKEIYDRYLKSGFPVDKDYYCRFDALESEKDLTDLFEVLSSFRDRNGNHPVITANTVVANPDFNKIRESDFHTYYYELFTESLKRYSNHSGLFNFYKEGINNKLFHPQFHGREHLNVNLWMDALRKKDKVTRFAFDLNSLGIPYHANSGNVNIMKALDFESLIEKADKKIVIDEGISIFESLFHYVSKSFIAPSYTWHSDLNSTLAGKGVRYLQGIPFQYEPNIMSGPRYSKLFHHCGQRNKSSQIYLIRNCHFEPSYSSSTDWVDDCLHRINTAFIWQKPAIVSAHRVNFIGSLDHSNTDRNLPMLKTLLGKILEKWPDVEFMTSDMLGDLMRCYKL
jgi:hypothetical protein